MEHIHPAFRHIVGLSNQERLEFLDQPRWMGYPVAQKIHDTLVSSMNKPVKPRMPNLLLIGEPNNGKTTIIRRFRDMHGDGHVDLESNPFKPIVIAEAPPSADERDSTYQFSNDSLFDTARATRWSSSDTRSSIYVAHVRCGF